MDKIFSFYKECPLKYSFIYPRYISECYPRDVLETDENFTGHYIFPDDFEFINRTDELWHQKSKFKDGMIVPDNDLKVMKTENDNEVLNYISNSETYIHDNEPTETSHYLNNLLNDKACLIKRSCGYWIGNTNTKERYQEMKPFKLEGLESGSEYEGKDFTVTMKKIYGFEPDLVSSVNDLSSGYVEGFSKKEYTLFVLLNSNGEVSSYIPTIGNELLTSSQIEQIITYYKSKNGKYPNNGTDNILFVSD